MGLMGLPLASCAGLQGILSGLTKSTDHPSTPANGGFQEMGGALFGSLNMIRIIICWGLFVSPYFWKPCKQPNVCPTCIV